MVEAGDFRGADGALGNVDEVLTQDSRAPLSYSRDANTLNPPKSRRRSHLIARSSAFDDNSHRNLGSLYQLSLPEFHEEGTHGRVQ